MRRMPSDAISGSAPRMAMVAAVAIMMAMLFRSCRRFRAKEARTLPPFFAKGKLDFMF
jgi:hypothetical protein